MSTGVAARDERTVAVENAGYRWSYLMLSFGMLAICAYRSFALRESSWDLLALVILGGAVNAAYQAARHVLYPRYVMITFLTAGLAALVAAGYVFIGRP